MVELRLPNINASTEAGQLQQIKSYLHQLTNQLNFALRETNNAISSASNTAIRSKNTGTQNGGTQEKTAEERFYELKDLIIKSADIIEAYSDEITKKLESKFVAQSEFGTFSEENEKFVEETAKNTTEYYSSLQKITGYVGLTDAERDALTENDVMCALVKDDFYIRTGWLDEDGKEGGIEIGQMTNSTVGKSRSAFARFTPDELYFFSRNETDEAGEPIILASFGNQNMMIRDAKIQSTLKIGGYSIETSQGGAAFKWVGER